MANKQTAVDWLVDEFFKEIELFKTGSVNAEEMRMALLSRRSSAKQKKESR